MKFFNDSQIVPIGKQFFVYFFLYLGNILVGITVMWSSPVIVKLQDAELTPLPYIITDPQASWLASIFYPGCILGPHLAGKLCNIIGRKYCLVLGGLISTVGCCLFAAVHNLPMLYVGRILIGFGLGMVFVTNLVLIGEIASPSVRGILLTLTGVFHSFGSLLAFAIGPFLSYYNFQYLILTLHVVYLIGIMFIPESPVFYIIKGRLEDAKKFFQSLQSTKDTDKEVRAIDENIQQSQELKGEFRELFTMSSNRKGFTICFLLLVFQNCSGIVAVSLFSLTIFQNAGTTLSPEVANIIFGTTQFLGTLIAPVFIERSGRKILLLISTTGCCISMIVLGVYFYLDVTDHMAVEFIGWLPLTAMISALLSSSAGLNIIPNTLVGEMFRPNVRSIGSSLCTSLGFLAGFGVTISFGYIVEGVGIFATFFMFAVINALGIAYTAIFVPETKGMSLIDIQTMLSK